MTQVQPFEAPPIPQQAQDQKPDPTQSQAVGASDDIQKALAVDREKWLNDPARTEAHAPQAGGAIYGQAGDMLWGVPPITEQQIATATGRASGGAANANADASGNTAGASGKAAELIAAAKSQLGVPYVYGAHAWGKALDCSGFTQGAFKQIGIDLGGDSYAQVKQGTAVQGGIANAVPGDLVFATGDIGMRTNGHVAIYLGNGKVIAAPHTGANVEIEDWSHNTSITAIRRII